MEEGVGVVWRCGVLALGDCCALRGKDVVEMHCRVREGRVDVVVS